MKRYLKHLYILSFYILVFTCGCAEDERDAPYYQASLQLIDSTEIKSAVGGLYIIDQKNGRFLSRDSPKKHLIIFDSTWNQIAVIDRQSTDDQGYGNTFHGGCFVDDSTIAVLGMKAFYFYNFRGDLQHKIVHPFNTNSGLSLPADSQKNVVYHYTNAQGEACLAGGLTSSTDFPSFKPAYYDEKRYITSTNIASGAYAYHGEVPKDSPYRKNYIVPNTSLLTLSKKQAFVLSSQDPTLLVYDLAKGFTLVDKVALAPTYFKTNHTIPLGRSPSMGEALESSFTNSSYGTLLATEKLLLAIYATGVNKIDFHEVYAENGLQALDALNELSKKNSKT